MKTTLSNAELTELARPLRQNTQLPKMTYGEIQQLREKWPWLDEAYWSKLEENAE